MEDTTTRSLADIVKELEFQSLGAEVIVNTLEGFNPVLNSSAALANQADLAAFIDIISTVIFNIEDGINSLIDVTSNSILQQKDSITSLMAIIQGDRLQQEEDRRELIDTLQGLSFGPRPDAVPPPLPLPPEESGIVNKFISFMGLGALATKVLEWTGLLSRAVKMFPILKVFEIGKVMSFIGAIPIIGKPLVAKIAPILGFMGKFGAFMSKFGKFIPIVGEIMIVVMGIIDTVRGAIEGFKTGGVLGAIKGGISGLLVGLVGAVLDLLKDMSSWIAKQLGFDGVSQFLDGFSFSTMIKDTVDVVVNFLTVIWSIVAGVGQWVAYIATPMIEKVKIFAGLFMDVIGTVLNSLAGFFGTIKDVLWAGIEVLGLDKFVQGKIIDPIADFFNWLGGFFSEMFTGAKEVLKNMFAGTNSVGDFYKTFLRGMLIDPRDHPDKSDPFYYIARAIPKSVYDYAGMDITGDSPQKNLANTVTKNKEFASKSGDLTAYRRSLMSDDEYLKLSTEEKRGIADDFKNLKGEQPRTLLAERETKNVQPMLSSSSDDFKNRKGEQVRPVERETKNIQPMPSSSGSTLAESFRSISSQPMIINNMGGNVTNTTSSLVNNNASPFEPILSGSAMGFDSH